MTVSNTMENTDLFFMTFFPNLLRFETDKHILARTLHYILDEPNLVSRPALNCVLLGGRHLRIGVVLSSRQPISHEPISPAQSFPRLTCVEQIYCADWGRVADKPSGTGSRYVPHALSKHDLF